MRLVGSFVATASAAVLAASGAQATTFLLTFESTSQSVGSTSLYVYTTGTPGDYTVTGYSGTLGGHSVDASPVSFDGSNNIIYYPSAEVVNFNGIAFSANGYDYQIQYIGAFALFCNAPSCAGSAQALDEFSLTPVSTPEPATWALMLTGFAGLGAALRARRKLAIA